MILIWRSKKSFKGHPSVTGGGIGSYGGENFMVKRTVDERENKLIFLDPIIILWVGEERRRSRFIGFSLWVGEGHREVQSTKPRKGIAKDMNNLSKPRRIIITLETNGDNMMNARKINRE
ncbi:unnamed protein product [Prunus armeniaca]